MSKERQKQTNVLEIQLYSSIINCLWMFSNLFFRSHSWPRCLRGGSGRYLEQEGFHVLFAPLRQQHLDPLWPPLQPSSSSRLPLPLYDCCERGREEDRVHEGHQLPAGLPLRSAGPLLHPSSGHRQVTGHMFRTPSHVGKLQAKLSCIYYTSLHVYIFCIFLALYENLTRFVFLFIAMFLKSTFPVGDFLQFIKWSSEND